MTIGYYTDNQVSKTVLKAFSRGGVQVAHINDFQFNKSRDSLFYGILRGTGPAMRHLRFAGRGYHYVDNGYFDAVYMDAKKVKEMGGKYRIVRDDMIEPIVIDPVKVTTGQMRIRIYPPSAYTAFMYDTTPEDWGQQWVRALTSLGHDCDFTDKTPGWSFDEAIKDFDALFTFNSTTVMRAIELGKAVFTTHGIIRNADKVASGAHYYDLSAMKTFYEPKQFTLEEIADRGVKCLN